MVTATPDNELPIFPFRPNWKSGVTQGFEFLTDIITSKSGAEQRRALRLTPRRSITYDVLFHHEERAFFENMIHMLGSNEFMVPIWWEAGRSDNTILAGASSVQFDQAYREFFDGEMGIILQDAFNYDVFEIGTVGAAQILFAVGSTTSREWPRHSKVYPLRRCRLASVGTVRSHSSSVSTASVEFVLVQANTFPTEFPFPDNPNVYRGHPVMTREPNWKEGIETTYRRLLDELDNETGLPHWFDEAARGFAAQSYGYQMRGQAAHMEFRKLLLDLKGRQKPIWMPTYQDDFYLAEDIVAGSDTLEVRATGYAYCGGPKAGREDIQIELRDGTRLFRRITGAVAGDPGRELLVVGEDFVDAVAVADVRKISFMDICRLDSDTVEIKHHSDTDGAASSTLVFRSFSDTRQELSTDPAFAVSGTPPAEPGPDGYIYVEMAWANNQRNMNLHIQFPDGTRLNRNNPNYMGGKMLKVGGDGASYRDDGGGVIVQIGAGDGGPLDTPTEIAEIFCEQRGAYTVMVEYYTDPETVESEDWPSVAAWSLDVTAPNGGGSFDGAIMQAAQGVRYPVTVIYID